MNILMPVMMFVLVYGTLAQASIGLYDATKIYFMAPFFMIGPVPFPGMPIICALLCTNLIFKLGLSWGQDRFDWPSLLTHLSILILLSGGFLTGMTMREGFIDLNENGPGKASISDYHKRVLAIDDVIIPLKDLSIGTVVPETAFHIDDICRNCSLDQEQGTMVPKPVSREDEENIATIRLTHQTSGQVIYLSEAQSTPVTYQDQHLIIKREERPLPFTLELIRFDADFHPGTQTASSYASIVTLRDGAFEATQKISMNQPMRYQGYTIYQASYFETESGVVSVLSVVENMGRPLPYIAGLLMGLGLIIQAMRKKVSVA